MIVIRPESRLDAASIGSVTRQAFGRQGNGGRAEAVIIDALRRAGALAVSLVAETDGRIVGHVAFSPVRVQLLQGGEIDGWYGLGPLSVLPDLQRQGIGSRLVRDGLAALKALCARGCVVLGEPDYYRRFGFGSGPGPVADGLPPEFFMFLSFGGDPPAGTVTYHPAFFAVE